MTKEYLSDDWKASMQLSFDFNHMMADFAADARAAVRSDLRKAAHNLEGKDLEKVQEAVAVLSDPPGRLLKKNFVEPRAEGAVRPFGQGAARRAGVPRQHRKDDDVD